MIAPCEALVCTSRVASKSGIVTLCVIGNDADAVWSAGLDIKNAAGFFNTPVLNPLRPMLAPGWWCCSLTQRVRHVPFR